MTATRTVQFLQAAALLSVLGSGVSARLPTHGLLRIAQVTRPGVHTEGPVWDRENHGLLFVDIAGQSLNFYDVVTKRVRTLAFDGPVSPVVPLEGGRLAVGVGRQLQVLRWSNFSLPLQRSPRLVATIEQEKPGNRFNDGKADRNGRIWIGTMGAEPVVGQVEPNQASFYRITIGRTKTEIVNVLSPVSISNGLAWSADDKFLYYIDTPTRRVDVFDFDLEKGTIANRRTAFDFAANNVTGNPDGMTIDGKGKLWIACFGGGQVVQADPKTGRLMRRVEIPASQVTSVAFGAPSDMLPSGRSDTLYVTTMRKGLTPEQLLREPSAGAVFAVSGLEARAQDSV